MDPDKYFGPFLKKTCLIYSQPQALKKACSMNLSPTSVESVAEIFVMVLYKARVVVAVSFFT